jgi:hypothetical protein
MRWIDAVTRRPFAGHQEQRRRHHVAEMASRNGIALYDACFAMCSRFPARPVTTRISASIAARRRAPSRAALRALGGRGRFVVEAGSA